MNIIIFCRSHRKEVWTFIQGEGEFILDDVVKQVKAGDTVVIEIGQKHGLKAVSDLHFIEVQIGYPLVEEDIERYEGSFS